MFESQEFAATLINQMDFKLFQMKKYVLKHYFGLKESMMDIFYCFLMLDIMCNHNDLWGCNIAVQVLKC